MGRFRNKTGAALCDECGLGTILHEVFIRGRHNTRVIGLSSFTFVAFCNKQVCTILSSDSTLGKISRVDGAVECRECGKGRYNDVTTSYYCKVCQQGRYHLGRLGTIYTLMEFNKLLSTKI